MTIHSNLMTSNKNFQKAEIVTLSDPIGEFCPHLLDTYIITYLKKKKKKKKIAYCSSQRYGSLHPKRSTYEY